MKKSTIFSIFACLLQLSCYTNDLNGQLVVQDGQSAEELAEVLIGSGVEISNVVLDCADGASGTFNGEFTSLGMNQGIMLSTGSIQNALGPNDEPGSTVENFTDNDVDLDLIASFGTNDACVLEFDVVPFGDTLRFNYVFGSDEYLEFVDQFNDVFAFFISGPGYDGPYSNNSENIALVPGTDIPVSINTINNMDNSEYFVCNGDPSNNCNNYFPEPDFNSTLQYDGLTVVMEAVAAVTPCETYHLKLAIADDLDFSFDSGVFIEAKSLSVDIVTLSVNTDFVNNTDFDDSVEGCVNGIVTFTRDFQNSQDLTIDYTISGTATNGVDYETIPSSITIPAGQSSYDLIIETINDGIPEGAETIIINYTTNFDCSDEFVQEVTLEILDYEPLVVSNDVTIQSGQTTTLNVSGGGLNYFWNPLYNISDATSQSPTVFPDSTTTYTITSAIGSCIFQESVTVFVEENTCDANAYFMPISICNNDGSVQLMAAQTGGSWSGSGVNASGIFSPQSLTPGDYEITHEIYIDADCSDILTQNITVLPNPDAFFQAVSLCNSDAPYQLTANSAGGSWSGTGVNANGIFDPSNLATGNYEITYSVTNANGCNSSYAQNIEVFESGNAAFSSSNFCFGDPSTSFVPVSSGGTWSGTGINQDGIFSPQGLAAGTYPVTYTIGSGTCQNSSTQFIRIIENPNSNFAAISLCNQAAPMQLQAEVSGGTWSGTGISSTGIFDPTGFQAGNYAITYSLTNADGCSSSTTQNISILNQVDAGFQAASFCIDGPPTQLETVTAGGNWSGSGVDQNGIFYPSDLGAGTYTITHFFDDANSCGGSFSAEISVYDSPDASFASRVVCADVDTIHLNANSQGGTWEGTGINAEGIFFTTGLAPGTYNISYSIVNEFGCGNSATGTVSIIAKPNSDFESNGLCINSAPIQLNANTAGGVWSGTGVSNNGIFDPTGLQIGSYNITYTVTNAQDCSSTSQGTISIFDGADSSFENQSICSNGGPIQLTANTAGGVWSGTNVSNQGIFDPAGLGAGNYEITYSITNVQNCNASSVGIVTVLEIPNSDFESFSICENEEPIQLTANTQGGTWLGTGISTDGIFDPSDLQIGNYNITYTIINAQGCSSISQGTVSIISKPDSAFEYQWFCPNDEPSQLTATTEGGVWSGIGISIDGIFDPAGLQTGNYDITYTLTNAQGCTSTSQGIVSIVDSPDSSFENQSICSNAGLVQLTANTEGGTWSGTSITSNGVFNPTGLAVGDYEISYTLMNADGCTSSSVGIINILETSNNAFENQSICANSAPVQLVSNTEGGTWSGTGVSNNGIFDPSGLAIGDYEISYTEINADGCTSNSIGIITILETPNSAFENQSVCASSEPVQLISNTADGTWSGTGVSVDGIFDPTGLAIGDYDISHNIINADGCSSSTSGIISIVSSPDTDFPDISICDDGSQVQLTATTAGGTWSGIGITENGIFDSTIGVGIYEITYTIDNQDGCQSTSTGNVVVTPNPDAFFQEQDFCENDPIFQFDPINSGGEWSDAADENGNFDPSVGPGIYPITYTLTNESGCSNSHTAEIIVFEGLDADFEIENEIICLGNASILTPINAEGIWSGMGVDENGVFDSNELEAGTYEITYTLESLDGCISSITKEITVVSFPDASFESAIVCYGDSISLTATNANGTWSGTGINETGLFNSIDLEAGDYEITYTIENENGCENSFTNNVTIPDSIPFADYDFNCIGGEGYSISFDIPNDAGITLSVYNGNSELVSEIENQPNSYELYFIDEPFAFIFMDINTGCESEYSFIVDDCAIVCDANAGEITLLETGFCDADTIHFEHSGNSGESVDTLLYLILDNPDIFQANILDITNEQHIAFTDIFQYNTSYYIVAFNGDLNDGFPNFESDCFNISESQEFNFTQPINVDFEIDCDPETAVFEVLYTITGGHPSSETSSFYTVSGDTNLGIDDEIQNGDQILQIYSDGDYINLIVSDNNGCSFEISEGPISCSKCGTEAGIISTEPIFVCEAGTVQNVVTDYSQFGLPLVYIVHTDVNNPPGEMLAVKPWTSYGEFSFEDLNPDSRAYNTQYYISAYIGPLDEAGFPDFDELNNCTVFMPGAPVVWVAPFEILVEANCIDDNNFEFIINFEGPALGSNVHYTININDGAFIDVFDGNGPYISPNFEAGGNSYFVEISIGGQCSETFQITNFDCTPGLALEMISFDGYKNGRTNKLVWQTATEYQNKYFSVQRSLNGIDFTEIGTINAIGNSNQLTAYSFEDANSNSQSWHYRLETFDINGKSEFTETIYLPRSIRGTNIVNAVYPNPVSNNLFIDINTDQTEFTLIKLLDVNGKILFNESATNINSILKIDVSHFATGVYFLEIQSNKQTVVKKILVE